MWIEGSSWQLKKNTSLTAAWNMASCEINIFEINQQSIVGMMYLTFLLEIWVINFANGSNVPIIMVIISITSISYKFS